MTRSVLVALLMCARVASADAPESEADESARHPAPHWLAGRLDGITAKLVVRYRLAVTPGGSNHFALDLPDNGVVTGATVGVEDRAHRLAFSAADRGSADFEAVLAKPAGPRRRWEVMVSEPLGFELDVDIAAPHAAAVTLDLEVDTPTCFSHGARYASVDPAWRASIDRSLRTAITPPDGCVARPNDEGGDGMTKAWIGFASDDGVWRPSGEQRVAIRGERVDVEHGRFARVELDLASELADIPADLHTVFVVDISRSVTERERTAQIETIESYLRHAPGTQIQIVVFARNARAVLPDWTRAGDAKLAMLATLPAANGSNVDTALVEASAWLSRARGTRRVVLFGDERLGKRVAAISPEALRGLLPPHTLVHVVAVDEVSPAAGFHDGKPPAKPESIARADDIAFAQVARDSEGLAARATPIDDKIDATKLVRPIALEQVTVHATGWTEDKISANQSACTGDLAKGTACTWFGYADPKPSVTPTIAIDGLLWNHPVHRTITPDAGQRVLLARLLTGFMANLGDAEHELQVLAHAVNPAWVLYGAWGAEDGYADEGFATMSGSVCGCDQGGMTGGFGFAAPPKVHASGPSIALQLDRATAACRVDAHVEVSIELTGYEIVDVAVTAPRADLRDCVTEAVWSTMLFVADPQPHAVERVSLGS